MLPWQKIVSWMAAMSFAMLVTWGTWATLEITRNSASASDLNSRVVRVEAAMGLLGDLRSDLRVLTVELRTAQDQLKHRACYEQ